MNVDAVLIGSILTVVGGVVVIGFLSYKVLQLMKKDEDARGSKE